MCTSEVERALWFQLRAYKFLINNVKTLKATETMNQAKIKIKFKDGTLLTVAYNDKLERDLQFGLLVDSVANQSQPNQSQL